MDDSPATLKLLSGMLSERGYRVRPASGGELALRSIKLEQPDLILLDVLMPGIGGYEVCQRIKALKLTEHIPVIFISALNETVDKVKGFEVGGVDYITKPFQVQEVLARVRTHLELRRLQKQLQYAYEQVEERVIQRTNELQQANRDLRDSKRELALRNRIAEIFLTVPDEQVYSEVLDIVLEVLDSKYGVFGYVDNNVLVCPSMTRGVWDKCQMADKTIVFPRSAWGGIWGRALIEKKTLYSNSTLTVPQGHVQIDRTIVVPIVHQDELIGHLNVANKPIDYTELDVALLETIASHIAPVLSARLQRDRQAREREFAKKELAKHAEQLSDANRELQMRQAELEEFIYAVSHDLKAPVVSISGFAGMIQQKMRTRDDTVVRYLNRIVDNVCVMEELISEVLDLTRIGRVEESMEPLDFGQIVNEVIGSFSPMASEKGIQLARADSFPHVVGWPNRIRQLVTNLVDNAVKYLPPQRAARVEIGFDDTIDAHGGQGAFYVRDNGPGIPREFHERIFGMFQRFDIDGRKTEGSGVGLTIVKRIVEKHGGNIWLDSAVGHGSTFYFTLPLSDHGPTEKPAPVMHESENSGS